MSAREKLNAAYFMGAFVVAALLGGITGSGAIFLMALALMVILAVASGDIRPPRG